MKKIIKNVLKVFVILYTICSLILFLYHNIKQRKDIYLFSSEYLMGNFDEEEAQKIEKEIAREIEKLKFNYGENSPGTMLWEKQQEFIQAERNFKMQIDMLSLVSAISIIAGIVIYYIDKNKKK